jgi:hypothetical protein
MFTAEIDPCPACGKNQRSIRCPGCKGKGTRGIFSNRDCEECSATGTMTLCLNVRCRRFDKRLAGWWAGLG